MQLLFFIPFSSFPLLLLSVLSATAGAYPIPPAVYLEQVSLYPRTKGTTYDAVRDITVPASNTGPAGSHHTSHDPNTRRMAVEPAAAASASSLIPTGASSASTAPDHRTMHDAPGVRPVNLQLPRSSGRVSKGGRSGNQEHSKSQERRARSSGKGSKKGSPGSGAGGGSPGPVARLSRPSQPPPVLAPIAMIPHTDESYQHLVTEFIHQSQVAAERASRYKHVEGTPGMHRHLSSLKGSIRKAEDLAKAANEYLKKDRGRYELLEKQQNYRAALEDLDKASKVLKGKSAGG